jgi:hypothetical protein
MHAKPQEIRLGSGICSFPMIGSDQFEIGKQAFSQLARQPTTGKDSSSSRRRRRMIQQWQYYESAVLLRGQSSFFLPYYNCWRRFYD